MSRGRVALVLVCVAAVLVVSALAGCGPVRPAALSRPDIEGTIKKVTGMLTTSTPDDLRATLLVEGKPRAGSAGQRAVVGVTRETRLFVRCRGGAVRVSIFGALSEGLEVKATFKGPARESDPIQVSAEEMVLIPVRSIEEVKSSHEDELMARPGVAGVGIGESGGCSVIKVFLESASRALAGSIPDSIEGYPVVKTVTGPLQKQ